MLTLALVACGFAGCGGPGEVKIAPEDNPIFGQHDGALVSLPDGGAVEVTTEQVGPQARVVAYFYGNTTTYDPLTPAPTDVSVDLALPGGESTTIALTAGGGEGRFASAPGDYVFDPFFGTINATVQGQSVSVPFSAGQ
ncbi:hypothetical protein [Tautonia rosea]|uniref:hypothetical protein n=1 Tax=Tautonia rosea TaxID=2728037 RepID=UPI001474E1BD|nr:hypothetical protein [Tautonia rosea]